MKGRGNTVRKELGHKMIFSAETCNSGINSKLTILGASQVAQTVKNLPAMGETWVQSLVLEDPWRRAWQPSPVILPGEVHGQRSLVAYSYKELDTTELN